MLWSGCAGPPVASKPVGPWFFQEWHILKLDQGFSRKRAQNFMELDIVHWWMNSDWDRYSLTGGRILKLCCPEILVYLPHKWASFYEKIKKGIDFQKILFGNFSEKWFEIIWKCENWKCPLVTVTKSSERANFKTELTFWIWKNLMEILPNKLKGLEVTKEYQIAHMPLWLIGIIINNIKLELAKYYKDSEMTAFI